MPVPVALPVPATGAAAIASADASTWTSASDGASLMPMRECNHLSGRGAHQFRSPARRRNAGTTTPRMIVASMTTASAVPMPNIFMKDSPLANEINVIVNSSAALVTIRPTRPSPMTVAALLSNPESRASLIRLSRKIS